MGLHRAPGPPRGRALVQAYVGIVTEPKKAQGGGEARPPAELRQLASVSGEFDYIALLAPTPRRAWTRRSRDRRDRRRGEDHQLVVLAPRGPQGLNAASAARYQGPAIAPRSPCWRGTASVGGAGGGRPAADVHLDQRNCSVSKWKRSHARPRCPTDGQAVGLWRTLALRGNRSSSAIFAEAVARRQVEQHELALLPGPEDPARLASSTNIDSRCRPRGRRSRRRPLSTMRALESRNCSVSSRMAPNGRALQQFDAGGHGLALLDGQVASLRPRRSSTRAVLLFSRPPGPAR